MRPLLALVLTICGISQAAMHHEKTRNPGESGQLTMDTGAGDNLSKDKGRGRFNKNLQGSGIIKNVKLSSPEMTPNKDGGPEITPNTDGGPEITPNTNDGPKISRNRDNDAPGFTENKESDAPVITENTGGGKCPASKTGLATLLTTCGVLVGRKGGEGEGLSTLTRHTLLDLCVELRVQTGCHALATSEQIVAGLVDKFVNMPPKDVVHDILTYVKNPTRRAVFEDVDPEHRIKSAGEDTNARKDPCKIAWIANCGA